MDVEILLAIDAQNCKTDGVGTGNLAGPSFGRTWGTTKQSDVPVTYSKADLEVEFITDVVTVQSPRYNQHTAPKNNIVLSSSVQVSSQSQCLP